MAYGLIYLVSNKINGMSYVGQTICSLRETWCRHRTRGYDLHKAVLEFGESAFTIDQIDSAQSQKELDEKEIFHIARLGTLVPNGYNVTPGGRNGVFNEEVRRRISIGVSNAMTLEVCKRISESVSAAMTPEVRKRISESVLKAMTPEVRKRIGDAGRGRKDSEETRLKRSKINKGRKFTEEHRRKIGEASKGRRHTEETKNRISASQKGHVVSQETREKIREGNRNKHVNGHKKTCCKNNHPFDEVNTGFKSDGQRYCKTDYFLYRTDTRFPEELIVYLTPEQVERVRKRDSLKRKPNKRPRNRANGAGT